MRKGTALITFALAFLAQLLTSSPAAAEGGTLSANPAPYPAMDFVPASRSNLTPLRQGDRPRYIVIHDTEISFANTIRTFQNPASRVSAHYVIRGSDGHITQMVPDWDMAWHSGHVLFNRAGIGIEHELDKITNPRFTIAQYQASARLVCAIASRYDIPLDRAHIVGHNEVPWPNTHTDPGPTWNWPYYMGLVRACGEPRLQPQVYHSAWLAQSAPDLITRGGTETVTVQLRNTGEAAWVHGSASEARLGIVNDDETAARLGYAVSWKAPQRPAVQSEPRVAPGGIATFVFSVRGAAPGSFRLLLRPVIDGVTWLEHQGIYVDLNVR